MLQQDRTISNRNKEYNKILQAWQDFYIGEGSPLYYAILDYKNRGLKPQEIANILHISRTWIFDHFPFWKESK
jgi:hypothetical protein